MDKLESLLDSYYGMQDEESAAQDARNIDSSNFDAAAAASDILAERSLPELISYQHMLTEDSKRLDISMQHLVFNNYNKFISATDTIRRMKDSVGEMESKMTGLVKDMREMGGSSALVNANLQENRGKIEKLVGVKRLLLKLEFLFELPVRLKRSIELDAQGQAVRYYCMVSGVLRKYDSIPSLHKIRVEADAIMNGLRQDLRAVLRERGAVGAGASSSRVVEAIQLLVQLEEPRPSLRTAYLSLQKTRLLASLNGVLNKFNAPLVAAQQQAAAAAAQAAAAAGRSGPSSTATSRSVSPVDGRSLLSARALSYLQGGQQGAGSGAAGSDSSSDGSGAGRASSSSSESGLIRQRAPESGYSFMQGVNRGFLDAFKVAAELYHDLFIEGVPAPVPGPGESEPSPAALAAVAAEKKQAKDALVAFTREVFSQYFQGVRAYLSLAPAENAGSSSDAAGAAAGGAGGSASSLASGKEAGKQGAAGGGKSGAGALGGRGHRYGASSGSAESAGSGSGSVGGSSSGAGGDGSAADSDEMEAQKAKAASLAAAAAASSGPGGAAEAASRFNSITDALRLLLTDVRGAAKHVREALLVDRAKEVTEAVLRAQLDGIFADVRLDVLLQVLRLYATITADLDKLQKEEQHALAAAATAAGGASAGEQKEGGESSSGSLSGSSPSPSSSSLFVQPYSWLQTAGGALSHAAENASDQVSQRIDEALAEARPLLLDSMRLLPDMSSMFLSLLHGQVLSLLLWLSSAAEALGDPLHPARAEAAAVVVEADQALDRENLLGSGRAGGASGRSGLGSSHVSAYHSLLRRRALVNFRATLAEAESVKSAAAGAAAQPQLQLLQRQGPADGGASSSGPLSYQSNLHQSFLSGCSDSPSFLLLLAVFCRHFASHGVARALSTMLSALPSRADLQAMGVSAGGLGSAAAGSSAAAGGGLGSEVESYGAMVEVPDLIKRTLAAGRQLLRRFVFLHSSRLTAILRRALVTASSSSAEPKAVRLYVQLLLEDLSQIKKLVGCTLGDWDARSSVATAASCGLGTAQDESAAAAAAAAMSMDSGALAAAAASQSTNSFEAALSMGGAGLSSSSSSSSSAAGLGALSLRAGAAGGVSATSLAAAQAAKRMAAIVGAAGSGSSAFASSTGSGLGLLGGVGVGPGTSGAMHMEVERLFRQGGSGGVGGLGLGGAFSSSGLGGVGSSGSSGAGSSGSSSSSFHAPLRVILAAVDYSSSSVMKVLLRCLFKSMVEWVRTTTLSATDMQQLQLDLAALHLSLPFFTTAVPTAFITGGGAAAGAAGGKAGAAAASAPSTSQALAAVTVAGSFDPYVHAGALEELLNEAAASASERCVDPHPLQMSVLYSLATAKLAGLQLAL